jgi:N-acetylmuramic acid 6-phosphate etherase
VSVSTETAAARFAGLDEWDSTELVSGILEGQFAAVAAVHAAGADLAHAIDGAAERLAGGGRLIYLGAGTSGRIAAQDAAELPPTFGWPPERAVTLLAGGQDVLFQAAEGAEDDEDLAIAELSALSVGADDVVIAVAASGRTPYAVAGLSHAREAGALTIGLFNNRGSRLGAVAEIPILLETGAEVIAGSTRMKAGTAQKAALNCLSTGIMVRLGFVYRGLMVGMAPSNLKLQDRATKMIASLTDASPETARSALDAAGGNIKVATIMIMRSLDAPAAAERLSKANGNLRKGLE